MSHFYEKYANKKIEYFTELQKLEMIFEGETHYYREHGYCNCKDYINYSFLKLPMAKNAYSIDNPLGLIKNQVPEEAFIDYCEFLLSLFNQLYIYNFTSVLRDIKDYYDRINKIIFSDLEDLNLTVKYIDSLMGKVAIIVVKDILLDEAIETINEENIVDKLLEYRAKRNEGDLEKKEEILKAVSNYVESVLKDSTLHDANKRLFEDVKFMINSLNIRHNNTDTNDIRYYKETFDNRERWLDYIYQEVLLVLLSKTEHSIHKDIENLKKDVARNID